MTYYLITFRMKGTDETHRACATYKYLHDALKYVREMQAEDAACGSTRYRI